MTTTAIGKRLILYEPTDSMKFCTERRQPSPNEIRGLERFVSCATPPRVAMLEGKPISRLTWRLTFTSQLYAASRHRTDFVETSLGDVGTATEKFRCETRKCSYKTHR